ncbi:MAG: hypothetical protein ABSD67_21835 [Terracidiphilus sp.]|jgi:hypothetical protein
MPIIILKRSASMPKDIWRLPSTRRTLPPLTLLESLLDATLLLRTPQDGSPALIESNIAEDGIEANTGAVRTLKDDDWAGIFELKITGQKVGLRLNEEACRREVHTPRRSSQFLTYLKPWEPIRVILNGKADWPSGRYYYLQDYHVILCELPRADGPLLLRTFDLQADLI